ncbi:MAG: hypothetical protein HQK93_06990, partial [Nitrospirae bacterium]|nr:hypothetical protein [Nitrospirota bacterium]
YNVHYSSLLLGLLPQIKTLKSYTKSFLKNIIPTPIMYLLYKRSKDNPKYLTNSVLNLIGIKSTDIAIIAGKKSNHENNPLFGRNTKYIWCQARDYDNYLLSIKNSRQTFEKENYLVFLDENFVFHPDFNRSKAKNPFTPEQYYGILCKFFDYIEKIADMKVIICAHPKAEYEDKPELFGGRKIVYFQTSDYVRNSYGVLMHCSTAINYAVLNRKPIIFMDHSKLNGTIWQVHIKEMARCLDKTPVILDDVRTYHFGNNFEVNEKYYEKYIDEYIIYRKDNRDKFSWEILEEYLSSIEI